MDHTEQDSMGAKEESKFQYSNQSKQLYGEAIQQYKADLINLMKAQKDELKQNLKKQRMDLKNKLKEIEVTSLEDDIRESKLNESMESLEIRIMDWLKDQLTSLSNSLKEENMLMEERLKREIEALQRYNEKE
ncbi:MAG: hypothetical protein ACQEWU_05825 [Bacillota bacterium]|uniref:Uncharacterized protein n=1 Tax=Virgibacillus salarius TaxID=447199 RepID=A0A941DVG5_9BACI|nr:MULTISPECIES: hypothetical protein [Bacillaceae]MBR7795854.1 hypothetical protein [Virgibacillus salarius]MDY7044299.1 hypothetical protein [Virgibacillus sp. M23]NAZ08566.1 hypothetical protein [Agaribacter marinus]WBX78894.1 hypothetical protein PD280_13760 [Virgibacillus salarius]